MSGYEECYWWMLTHELEVSVRWKEYFEKFPNVRDESELEVNYLGLGKR